MAKHMKSLEYSHSHDMEMTSRINYPTAYLGADQMPEIKDWEVGEEYTLKVVVVLSQRTEVEGKINGTLELRKYETTSDRTLS